MIYTLIILFLITAVGAGIRIWRSRRRDAAVVIDRISGFYIFTFVGIAGISGFLGHAFSAESVAQDIGWPAGNPFQSEVAVANLAYGVAGLICVGIGGGFRWATAVFTAVFLWGAAYIHIYEYAVNGNSNPGNIGMALYVDIIVPIVFFGLLGAGEIARRRVRPAAARRGAEELEEPQRRRAA